MKEAFNIILFGETGAGKSSVVNLMVGNEVARTSGDGGPCTLAHEVHRLQVNGTSYTIWDTRGFDEADTETGVDQYLVAMQQAYTLIQDVSRHGGVDLLVLCHRGGRITTATRSNYRLFYEVLCEGKVPLALVVTYLERHTRMEDWWDQNEAVFDRRGFKIGMHACVTGMPGHPKSGESKQAIENMLAGYDGDMRYCMPVDEWFGRFLKYWPEFRRLPKGLRQRDLENFLQRCGLSPSDARDVATTLRKSDGGKKGLFGIQWSNFLRPRKASR